MNLLIIWSKNRACQLELLLRSIKKNLDNTFVPYVLYNYSDNDFKKAYEELQKEYPTVSFIKENDFREDTLELVRNIEVDNVGFACDDNVIFKKQDFVLPRLPFGATFSLRLGKNTIVQNCHTGQLQPELDQYTEFNKTISWLSTHLHPLTNYGYPFSLDMHFYNRGFILELIESIEWNNTNELEGRLCQLRNHCPFMEAPLHSISVNIPLNNLSGVTQVSKHSYSNVELNQAFLEGKRLKLETVENTKIIGAHQEIDLELE